VLRLSHFGDARAGEETGHGIVADKAKRIMAWDDEDEEEVTELEASPEPPAELPPEPTNA
jgi:hypothetical protein